MMKNMMIVDVVEDGQSINLKKQKGQATVHRNTKNKPVLEISGMLKQQQQKISFYQNN